MHRAFVLLLFLLAACSSAPEVTDVPFYTATPNDFSSQELDFMGTDLPLESLGGNPEILITGGSFSFAVSGEVVSQQQTGTIVYSFVPVFGTIPEHEQLYIAASDADSTEQISFEFSKNLPIGQYPLVSPIDFIMGTVSAQYQRLAATGEDATIESYNQEVQGILNIIAAGEMLSGDFQFTAAYIQRSPEGEVQTQRVEVTGTFADVPYLAAGSDPFEVSVPLPTRVFTGTEVPVETSQP